MQGISYMEAALCDLCHLLQELLQALPGCGVLWGMQVLCMYQMQLCRLPPLLSSKRGLRGPRREGLEEEEGLGDALGWIWCEWSGGMACIDGGLWVVVVLQEELWMEMSVKEASAKQAQQV